MGPRGSVEIGSSTIQPQASVGKRKTKNVKRKMDLPMEQSHVSLIRLAGTEEILKR